MRKMSITCLVALAPTSKLQKMKLVAKLIIFPRAINILAINCCCEVLIMLF